MGLSTKELEIMEAAERILADCTYDHCPEVVMLAQGQADKMRLAYPDIDDVTMGRILLGVGTAMMTVPDYDVKRQAQLIIHTACELTRLERAG